MKQRVFTLLLLAATGLLSCKKTQVQPTIQQADQTQIENYISVHGITGMKRDLSGGDTTGIYYQIITPGDSVDDNGQKIAPLNYPDKVSMVFTLRSFDGKYIQTDTIANHFDDYLGHMAAPDKLPLGVELSILNDLRYRGGSIRMLIPSRLAYGRDGYGSGSVLNANTRIAGNQCLDYYVHLIGTNKKDNEAAYDDLVINNYMQANSLTGYAKVQSTTLPGNYYYYKILTPATSTTDPINDNTTITTTYTTQMLNGTIVDDAYNGTNTAALPVFSLVPGVKEALENFAFTGTKISILIPSVLGYGEVSSGSAPVNSCLRFTFQINSITP
jgi:FKBP-type peptidyl-prolyl cis-trans isomerase FkpA